MITAGQFMYGLMGLVTVGFGFWLMFCFKNIATAALASICFAVGWPMFSIAHDDYIKDEAQRQYEERRLLTQDERFQVIEELKDE